MSQPPRKKTAPAIETAVLVQSARRCPVCFHLHGDLTVKLGQIAHLDGDRTNGAEDNLAWMCLPHHSEYDSTTSQHKNLTIGEVKTARLKLYEAVAAGRHQGDRPRAVAGRETDQKTLDDLVKLLGTSGAMRFLKEVDFGGSGFSPRQTDNLDIFEGWSAEPHSEFLDPELEGLRIQLVVAVSKLLSEIALKLFSEAGRLTLPHDWKRTRPNEFATTVAQLSQTANKVYAVYDELVRTGRKKLAA